MQSLANIKNAERVAAWRKKMSKMGFVSLNVVVHQSNVAEIKEIEKESKLAHHLPNSADKPSSL